MPPSFLIVTIYTMLSWVTPWLNAVNGCIRLENWFLLEYDRMNSVRQVSLASLFLLNRQGM